MTGQQNVMGNSTNGGRIRPLKLNQIFRGIESQSVEIGAIDPDTQHPNHVDMLYVCAIARHVRARRIFEFGTYLGRTTYHLALGPDSEDVYTLDLDPAHALQSGLKLGGAVKAVLREDLQGYFWRNRKTTARIHQLHGDSRAFDCGPFEHSMDLVFVDADHSYESVWADTRNALRMIREGGIIIWHDFAPKSPGVTRFAEEFAAHRALFWVADTSLLLLADGVDPLTFSADVPVYARERLKPKQS